MPDSWHRERMITATDQEFAERAAKLVDKHGGEDLLDVPREARAKLFAWRTREYRKAWGRDPRTGELTPAEKHRRRLEILEQREGEH